MVNDGWVFGAQANLSETTTAPSISTTTTFAITSGAYCGACTIRPPSEPTVTGRLVRSASLNRYARMILFSKDGSFRSRAHLRQTKFSLPGLVVHRHWPKL